ncbi:energy transducer TonB [Lacisediminimonas sp.]|uniref:energy transducer TonB family protein n=1 Tax=Lacisediminimonas sp. TaxID=3060582 RepID=UPI002724D310|nr:energy transducer TonB [Lacisediminimonas sp.]MDO8298861.1 energy transducer TonB [Lacisediminimonas sp.]
MQYNSNKHLFAVFFSVALHATVLVLASNYQFKFSGKPDVPKADEMIVYMEVLQPPPEKNLPVPANPPSAQVPAPAAAPSIQAPKDSPETTPVTQRQPVSMAAPSAPTAEEWAFAAKYTLKNSKAYRYSWGQQVRSMMGAAVEGPNQGVVRFRVEVAPDGTLAKLETLWTTSTVAEQLARKAIENMPPLPPTPTGKPLIFERTISFTPFASDGPPIYKDDCLPDPPSFRNPFAWDGKSPQLRIEPKSVEKLDPQEMVECLRQLPQDSIEAESARDQRLMDQWGSGKPGR